jgi:hypothetical protein
MGTFEMDVKGDTLRVKYELDAKGEVADMKVFHHRDERDSNDLTDALSASVLDRIIQGIEGDVRAPKAAGKNLTEGVRMADLIGKDEVMKKLDRHVLKMGQLAGDHASDEIMELVSTTLQTLNPDVSPEEIEDSDLFEELTSKLGDNFLEGLETSWFNPITGR